MQDTETPKISNSAFVKQTAFGLFRITLWLALPAVFIIYGFHTGLGESLLRWQKGTLVFFGLILGWIMVFLDYRFIMPRISILEKTDRSNNKSVK